MALGSPTWTSSCCSKHMLASQRRSLKNPLLSPRLGVPKSPTKPLRNMAPTRPSPPLVGEPGRVLQQRRAIVAVTGTLALCLPLFQVLKDNSLSLHKTL